MNYLLPGNLYILVVCTHMLVVPALLPSDRIKGRPMSGTTQHNKALVRDIQHSFDSLPSCHSISLLTTACLRPTPLQLCRPCLLLTTRRPASPLLYCLLRPSSSPTSSSSQTSSLTVPSLPHFTMTETPSWPSLSTGYFPVLLTLPRERWPPCATGKWAYSLRTATTTAHQAASASYATL